MRTTLLMLAGAVLVAGGVVGTMGVGPAREGKAGPFGVSSTPVMAVGADGHGYLLTTDGRLYFLGSNHAREVMITSEPAGAP